MSPHQTWAWVADGVRARVLRGFDGGAPEGFGERISKAASTHRRTLLSGKAGRSRCSVGIGRRSAMEPGHDPIRCDLQDFAQAMRGLLDDHCRAGRLTRLAIFATPRMPGILRQEISEPLRCAVILGRATNLVHLPTADLRKALRDTLREAYLL